MQCISLVYTTLRNQWDLEMENTIIRKPMFNHFRIDFKDRKMSIYTDKRKHEFVALLNTFTSELGRGLDLEQIECIDIAYKNRNQ